jgi:hypothetical protein
MDKKKKIITTTVATSAVVATAGVGIGVYISHTNDAKDNLTEKKEVSTEQRKYHKIIKIVDKVGVPTIFDNEGKNPFQTAFISNGVTNDVYLEFMISSKSGKEMKYVLMTNGDQFNVIKNSGEYKEKELKNGLKVYTNGTSYYWQDKEKQVYGMLNSLNPKTTKAEDLEKAILSIGDSKFDVRSNIDYGFKNIKVPSYTIGDSDHMELLLDYQSETVNVNKKANYVINLIYNDVEIGQSKTYDFMTSLSDEDKKESVEVNGEPAYIVTSEDSGIVRVYYNYKDTSLILQVGLMTTNEKLLEDTEYAKKELLKVLKSIPFE